MAILLSSLVGLAAVDALNPFSIAALVYLLATNRPAINGLVFVAGTYVTYLAGGLLILAGWQALVAAIVPYLPWWAFGVFEATAGVLLLGVALWMRFNAKGADFKPPADLNVWAIVIFGVTSTIADLTSALPYFGAINLLVLEPTIDSVWRVLGIALYCLIYCFPLILVVLVRAVAGPSVNGLLSIVRGGIDWAMAKLLGPMTLLAGLALVLDGVRRLL